MEGHSDNTSRNARSRRKFSASSAAAFLEAQVTDHTRIKKMFRFLTPSGDLDRKVAKVVEKILLEPPSQDLNAFQLSDVADMIHGFQLLDQLIQKSFFVTLPLSPQLVGSELAQYN